MIITWEVHQINSETIIPKRGKIDTIFIMTVIPRYDIWPRLRTWPKNPSIKHKLNINRPETRIERILVSITLNPIQAPRIQWINIKNINNVAPIQWYKRMNQPILTSSVIYTTGSKAMV